ncbi:MAG: alpha/beta hydrolase [Planctomycetaceae bacterium]|nr:alpha/beta hydrolase [Planctomycetaceae bacterium]
MPTNVMTRRQLIVASLLLSATSLLSAAEPIQVISDLGYRRDPVTDYEETRCKLDLYLPQGVENFPTIVWFHGGGLQNGDKTTDIAVAVAQRFAAEGVAVASVNYRLSPQVKFPAYIEDAAAAVAYVQREIENHGGDPHSLFVSGHSAGGYLTLMVGLDARYLEPHGLKPTDIAGFMPVAGQTITHSTVREERGIPKTRPTVDSAAPLFHASKDAPPFLCFAGSNDLPMRAEENALFAAAMKAAGHRQTSYLLVADRDHGAVASRIPEPNDPVAAAMKAFIDDHRRLADKSSQPSRAPSLDR